MKLLFCYIKKIRYSLIWGFLCGGISVLVLLLSGVRWEQLGYPALLCAVISLVFFTAGFVRMWKKHAVLKMNVDDTGDIREYCFPEADHVIEEDYQRIIRKAEQAFGEEREKNRLASTDMQDYYARWVHQIKAPIAVMRVLLQQEDNNLSHELSAELFRVEQYVDMALCYARLEENASDLVIQEYSLDEIIRKAVRKYAGQFIRKRIRLQYEGTDETVLTDEKWLSFIIEQLLSNAVKYTAKGSVSIKVEEGKKVVVEDTGIGIALEDLPRIFEKGYTGYNGRMDKKSTGLGLYLCKTAADKLNHGLSAESVPGEGSRFILSLDTYPFLA